MRILASFGRLGGQNKTGVPQTMTRTRNEIRGAKFFLTLPHVFQFTGMWLLVTAVAVLAHGVSSYLVVADRLRIPARRHLLLVLGTETVLVLLALLALAVFTTHRLAGPWIAVKRACDEIRTGDAERQLRLRRTDPYLREVEVSFNAMTQALREGPRSTPSS